MDLNKIPSAPQGPLPNTIEPGDPALKPPLRIVRLKQAHEDMTEALQPFTGGEALPESQGEDFPMPISEAEREALEREGYQLDDEPVAVGLVDKGFTNEPAMPLHSGPDAMDRAMHDLKAELEAQQAAAEAMYYSRPCPLPTCDAIARVPKGEDQGDILGLGMSMTAAAELEDLLLQHLQSHSFGDWIAALKKYEDALKARFVAPEPRPGIVHVPAEGVIPGASHRSPEKQAAVDALDARLSGRPVTPQTPEEVQAHDDRLREIRRQRRAAAEASPYDLTPRWSAELENGVVGIKR